MTTLFIILSFSSILASIFALYVLIIATFEKKEKKEEKGESKFVKRESRTITTNKNQPNQIQQSEGLNTQASSLLWTVVIGQVVGLYILFVFLEETRAIYNVLRFNAFILLFASFLCSILTMLNGWFKKKMDISSRLLFQGYSFFIAMILFRIGIGKGITVRQAIDKAGILPDVIAVLYFLTAVIALVLMLLDVSENRKYEHVDFNFNFYLLIVVIVGMFVGISLKIALAIL